MLLAIALSPFAHAQAVVVPTTDPAALSAALAGPGITLLSVTVTNAGTYTGVRGSGPSVGTFSGGPVGMPPGIVVSDGWAGDVVGTPELLASGTSSKDKYSALCASMVGQGANDAVEVQAQFTVDAAYAGIELQYSFGTEEAGVPDVDNDEFADSFGAFLATDTGGGFGADVDVAVLSPDPACIAPYLTLNASSDACFWGHDFQSSDTALSHVMGRTTHRLPLATGPAVVHRLTFVACDTLDQSYDTAGFVGAIQPCAAGCVDAFSSCGDGVLDPGEVCDDGNNLEGDGCTPGCDGVSADSDGDGLLDEFEATFGAVVGAADTDGDGLLDSEILDYGTSPALVDTDGDGLPDPLELGLAGDADPSATTDPLTADTDGDGLVDGDEDLNHDGKVARRETDPNAADTDHDGLDDGYEGGPLGPDSNGNGWADALDPGRSDKDGDGLKDAVELGLGTDVWNADTDGDGLLDGADLCPLVADPLDIDEDRDGLGAACDPAPLDADTDDDGVVDGRDRDPVDPDTDGDGLTDGLEHGATHLVPGGISAQGNAFTGTDPALFVPDLDPSTATRRDLADTDADGLDDGDEDLNHDGAVERWEGDPNLPDTDGDGISDNTDCNVATEDPSSWITELPTPGCPSPPCHAPLGGSHTLATEAEATLRSAAPGTQVAWVVGALPDVTGDGADEYVQSGAFDVCVGSPEIVPGGFVGAAPLTDAIGVSVQGSYLTKLVALPDLGGDGSPDLLFGSGSNSDPTALSVDYLRAAPLAQVAPTPDATFTGGAFDVLYSLAGGGDADGDGVAELAITGKVSIGYAVTGWIYPASTSGNQALSAAPTQVTLGTGGAALDSGLVFAGDADGDGIDDLATWLNGDVASLLYGPVSGVVTAASLPGESYGSVAANLQIATIATGDVDGDGRSDLVVGDTVTNGALHVILGGGSGAVPVAWADVLGAPGDSLGASVKVADLDGDGALDVAATATHSVVLLQGPLSPGILDLSLAAPTGRWSEPALTTSGLAVGDFDGDAYPDVAVGVPGSMGTGYLATLFGGSF